MYTASTIHLPIARRLNNESAASRSSGSRIIVILTFPVSQLFYKDFSPNTAAGPHGNLTRFPIMPVIHRPLAAHLFNCLNYICFIINSFIMLQIFQDIL
jgi:hypothetical protein